MLVLETEPRASAGAVHALNHQVNSPTLVTVFFFIFLETGLFCVAMESVTGLELTDFRLPLASGIKGLCQHWLGYK